MSEFTVVPGGAIVESFVGRVAVVTGGASGISRALALGLAREGARVVVADRDEAGMAEVVTAIRALGGEAIAVPTDVSELAQVQALAARAFSAFSEVHVLCNNAGVATWAGSRPRRIATGSGSSASTCGA